MAWPAGRAAGRAGTDNEEEKEGSEEGDVAGGVPERPSRGVGKRRPMRHADPFVHPTGPEGARAGHVMARQNAAAEVRATRLVAARTPVLELGCGPGVGLRHLGPRGVGVDLSRPMVRQARMRAPAAGVVQADARSLPFAADVFHAAMAVHCLEILPVQALEETRRVLVTGAPLVAIHRTAAHGGPRPSRLMAHMQRAGFKAVTRHHEAGWTILTGQA